MKRKYLLLWITVCLAACHNQLPAPADEVSLGQDENGDSRYLLTRHTVHGAHPLFSFAVMETRYRTPWISSMFVNEKDGLPADKYVSYRQTWYAVDCRTSVWKEVGSSDYHADGHVVESTNEYAASYPPTEYQMVFEMATCCGSGSGTAVSQRYYQEMSDEERRDWGDAKHPVVQAVCGKTA